MTTTDLAQIRQFEQRFARAQASAVVDLPWGFALLQDDFPDSHSHNRLVVTSPASSSEILSAAEDLLAHAGRTHRCISVADDAVGQGVWSDIEAAGYEGETLTTMVFRGPPPAEPDHQVQAVPHHEVRPALLRDWQLQLPTATAQVLDQLAGRTSLYTLGADASALVVFESGEVAARVDLYLDPKARVAQIESLFTHPSFRSRGYARSLVLEAIRRSLDAGCRLCFLEADSDDWPRGWYRRMNFVEVRRTHGFTRLGAVST